MRIVDGHKNSHLPHRKWLSSSSIALHCVGGDKVLCSGCHMYPHHLPMSEATLPSLVVLTGALGPGTKLQVLDAAKGLNTHGVTTDIGVGGLHCG